MATLTSKLIVELIDRATAPARAIAAGVNRLTAMQSRNAAALATAQSQMVGAAAIAYGLAKAISAPVKAAVDFETKLEDIGQKINAPVSDLPKLGEELRAVARQTTQTASQMAEGMDVLAGMGASREDALGLLPAIGRAATAYNAEIGDLSQAGYAALDNLKVPANQFGKALDAMAQAGKAGAFELKDMAKYFPQLGAGYQALNQKGVPAVADLSAALQIVRKGAGDSSTAANNLSNVLQKINAPLTRKNFEKMGVNLEKEMKRAAKAGLTPIEAITTITNKALKGNLGRLGDLFNDKQVQDALRPLIQNIEEYRRIRKEALAAQGVVEEDYQRRLKTGASAIQRFRIALEGINLAIGAALLPGLTDLADAIVPLMNRMENLAEKHPALTRAVVATAAGLVGLRVAGFAAAFGLRWMWGGALAVAIGSMRLLAGAARLGAIALFPFGAALRGLRAAFVAARSAMLTFVTVSSLLGTGGALRMAGAALLGLLNPLRLVAGAMAVLRFAMLAIPGVALLTAIAAAGMFIYNNWSGIKEMFAGIWGGLTSQLPGVTAAIQPIINGFTWLSDKLSGILGPINMSKEAWRDLGVTMGTSLGEGIKSIVEIPGRVIAFTSEMVSAGRALMASLLEGIKSGAQAVLDYVTSIGSRIKSGIAGAASGAWSAVKGAVGAGSGSTPAAAASASAPATAGARAAGGPVRAGSTYLVGEKGPELFQAPATGHITSALETARMLRSRAQASTPNTLDTVRAIKAQALAGASQQAGGTTTNVGGVTIHVTAAPGQSPEAIAAAVESKVTGMFRSINNGAFSDGVN